MVKNVPIRDKKIWMSDTPVKTNVYLLPFLAEQ